MKMSDIWAKFGQVITRCLGVFAWFALEAMFLAGAAGIAFAAPPDRIIRPINPGQTRVLHGNLHRLAQPEFDLGPVEPETPVNFVTLVFKPTPAQQAELNRLLSGQQNPSSPLFHQWLAPEEFGNRFGLSSADISKVIAWLASEGFTMNEAARGRNWIAFSGTAAQMTTSLHTPIHRFLVNGKVHFANAAEPSVPDALGDVVGGFLGLDDFTLEPFVTPTSPQYTAGSSHYMVPGDFATIYDLTSLYQAGMDGTGQRIAVVGQSEVLLTDIISFRNRYGLPPNNPYFILYGGTSPGYNSAQLEGNLDLEWAGAIAPKATIDYVYGANAMTAIVQAVNMNVAPVISISYGDCEIDYPLSYFRSITQQANAQGITLLSASGDSGAAGCDPQAAAPFAALGRMVDFPAVLPEVTGVGGTEFVEGNGTYWASTNSSTLASALSYIPEAAWNESSNSLNSGGGGASIFYSQPSWQTGPGVPNDNVRHVPDLALSAAVHDGYYILYTGMSGAVGGTSASTPSMAGIIALLNQYQVSKSFQKQAGLGNINPQLYRLAQAAPTAFHDITAGSNIVPCAQGSPDCPTGSFGYSAGPGYDMATGLGSVDAYNLVTQWNTATQAVTVVLSLSATNVTMSDTITLTAEVSPASGSGTPTGTVAFAAGTVPLGSVVLPGGSSPQSVSLSFPAYVFAGVGIFTVSAQYSGDAAFSGGGATKAVQVVVPTNAAGIVISWPNTVWAASPDAQGLSWPTTITISEIAGVPALITGLTIDGSAQNLSDYFPSPNIAPKSSFSTSFVFRNLTVPLARVFVVTGTDANRNPWSRTFTVNYNPPLTPGADFRLSASPLVVTQNTAADSSCQWQVLLHVDDVMGGIEDTITGLHAGNVDMTSQIPSIFGTPRLNSWASLQGKLCFGGIVPPASEVVEVDVDGSLTQQIVVSFAGPPANPTKITSAPTAVNLTAHDATTPASATLSIGIADKTQPWTLSIYPANRTSAWLTASQYTGTGPAQIALTASGTGFEPGAYWATVVIQSPNAVPQIVNVPVMFVLGGNTSGTAITAAVNSGSFQPTASPGMLLSVFGSNLSNSTATAPASTVAPYSLGGVTATVNDIAAPLFYVSPNQLNIQVPQEVGAGPAVLGINNNGAVAGFPIQVGASAPAIFTDGNGNVVPNATVTQGGYGTIFFTGAGEISNLPLTGQAPSVTTPVSSLGKPCLPLSITVGGAPALIQFDGQAPGKFGTTQVNFIVPPETSVGDTLVIVTVGGVASPPAHINVAAPQPVQ
ncbi:MAG: protease pro-enzyme activation domain-containing protein [Bryobacteraceae bacterium]|jgi:uncharacterized protein (TIGR03437 family)